MVTDDRQAGYATATVAVILGALALLAAGWRDLALADARRAAYTAAAVRADAAVDGAFAEVIAEIADGRLTAALASHQRDFNGLELTVSVTPLEHLTNLNTAAPEVIAALADTAALPVRVKQALLDAKLNYGRDRKVIGFLEDVSADPSYVAALPCIRAVFTTFQNAAPGDSSSDLRWLSEGTLFSVHIVHTGRPLRGADITGILTGDADRPVIVYDWRRLDTATEECHEIPAARR